MLPEESVMIMKEKLKAGDLARVIAQDFHDPFIPRKKGDLVLVLPDDIFAKMSNTTYGLCQRTGKKSYFRQGELEKV